MQVDREILQTVEFCNWTTSQRELWPLVQLETNGASLNTGQYTEILGAVDRAAFDLASRQTLTECEALRVRIAGGDDAPELQVAPLASWTPGWLDLSHEIDSPARALEWMELELARPFAPQGAMVSWTLIKLSEQHFIWCFIVNQLALDGAGRNIVARRLAELYSKASGTLEAASPPAGPLQDLLSEDASYHDCEEYQTSRNYWRAQIAELPPPVRLNSLSSMGSYLAARCTAPLAASTTAAIRDLMSATKLSLSGLFAAAVATYLHRLGGNANVVVGLLVSARTNDILRGIPGNVSNTVPLKIKFRPDLTVDSLAVQVRARVREALKHQRFPLSDMKAELPSLDGELFSVAINVMKFDYALKFGAASSISHNLSNGPVDDLSLSIFEQPGENGLQIALNGNTNRYSAAELKSHYDGFVRFLDQFCRCAPATRILEAPFVQDVQVLASVNPTGAAGRSSEAVAKALSSRRQYVAPANAQEEALCQLFGEVFATPRISAEDNFFEIGGHSLLAARLITLLNRKTKTKLPLRTIFEHPTPRALARFLDEKTHPPAQRSSKPLLVLLPGGGVITKEVVALKTELAATFSVLTVDYPDWRNQFESLFDVEKYLATIIAQIRHASPTPCPLRLVGYSFGGGVSYAIAIMLAKLGYAIEFIGIIDGRSPVMIAASEPAETKRRSIRWWEMLTRERSARNYQIGRYIGIRAKRTVVKKILRTIGPYMPSDESSQLLFYMTSFINASLPMEEIRKWTGRLPESERMLGVKAILFRSSLNEQIWPEDLGWFDLIPNLYIVPVPGNHFTVIGPANLSLVCSHIVAAAVDATMQHDDAVKRLEAAGKAMAAAPADAPATPFKQNRQKSA